MPRSYWLQVNAAQLNVPRGPLRERGRQHQSHQHRTRSQLMLIMTISPLPDAMKPDFHCVRTHWIPGFMTFHRVRHARNVMLMVPA
jgi:hypothetical protein